MVFLDYEPVRVLQMLRAQQSYDDWGINQRRPQVGDVGTLLEVLRSPGVPDRFVVEMAGADGVPIWLADFLKEELESLNG